MTAPVLASALACLLALAPGADPCESVDPAWSPDGQRIAFAADCDGNPELYVMDPDGGRVVRLTETPGEEHQPAWSPDGARIAYGYRAPGEDAEIWTIAADGSDPRRLTDNDVNDWAPAWSPDGARLAYESRREENDDVWILDLASGVETRLTNDPAKDLAPDWSPDGATIAIQSDRDGGYGVHLVDAASGAARRRMDLDGVAATPAWSPDGERLAFLCEAFGGAEICVAGADGSGLRRVTDNARTDFAPDWSPDGARLAFMSRSEGHAWEIYVVGADGTGERRLTFGDEQAAAVADSTPPWMRRPCREDPAYAALDFWLGEWDVFGPSGEKAGRNRIEKDLAGCLVLERWTGVRGVRGMSVNYRDPATGRWVQRWVSELGAVIELEGNIEQGSMVWVGTQARADGSTVDYRMTLTPEPDGTVRQVIETSADGGATWEVGFDGRYVRAAADGG